MIRIRSSSMRASRAYVQCQSLPPAEALLDPERRRDGVCCVRDDLHLRTARTRIDHRGGGAAERGSCPRLRERTFDRQNPSGLGTARRRRNRPHRSAARGVDPEQFGLQGQDLPALGAHDLFLRSQTDRGECGKQRGVPPGRRQADRGEQDVVPRQLQRLLGQLCQRASGRDLRADHVVFRRTRLGVRTLHRHYVERGPDR